MYKYTTLFAYYYHAQPLTFYRDLSLWPFSFGIYLFVVFFCVYNSPLIKFIATCKISDSFFFEQIPIISYKITTKKQVVHERPLSTLFILYTTSLFGCLYDIIYTQKLLLLFYYYYGIWRKIYNKITLDINKDIKR